MIEFFKSEIGSIGANNALQLLKIFLHKHCQRSTRRVCLFATKRKARVTMCVAKSAAAAAVAATTLWGFSLRRRGYFRVPLPRSITRNDGVPPTSPSHPLPFTSSLTGDAS